MGLDRPAAALILCAGCGWGGQGDPYEEAHRAAAGYWPENSRSAVQGTIAAGYAGVEIDLFLTGDMVPVLAHDAHLDPTLCTTVDGAPIGEEEWIYLLTYDQLVEGFVCGGVADPEMPDAAVTADTVLSFDEFIEEMAGAPEMITHLDIKYVPNVSHSPDVYAAEIMERWWAADLPNPTYMSADLPETIQAFKDRADDEGVDLPASLTWPRFAPESNSTAVALSHEVLTELGMREIVDDATDAGADGLNIPWQTADRRGVEIARDAGLDVQIWTVNDERLKESLRKWDIQAIITDIPVAP